jgi:3-methyladenine DNA glycosylase/8-oxoguanine DNA glycosylase
VFENGDLSAEFLANARDKEIMDRLVKVRGIGVKPISKIQYKQG